MKILLTGATGFVGAHLLQKLKELSLNGEHLSIRCLVRDSKKSAHLQDANVELFEGDVRDLDSTKQAMSGCDAAYYLVHSMLTAKDFRQTDRLCASNFSEAAAGAGVQRIIYLSGLANEETDNLSEHLASRLEVGKVFRAGQVPSIELKAAMIIGDGSLSFRMVEHLCNRLPVMICPKWLSTLTQPIALSDVLKYLVASLTIELRHPLSIEIGGADQTTYLKILKEYCLQKNLKRLMIPVPLLTPNLSALWLGLVTPETAKVGRAMIDGLRNPTFVRSNQAKELFGIEPMSMKQAIELAIEKKIMPDSLPLTESTPDSNPQTDQMNSNTEIRAGK